MNHSIIFQVKPKRLETHPSNIFVLYFAIMCICEVRFKYFKMKNVY